MSFLPSTNLSSPPSLKRRTSSIDETSFKKLHQDTPGEIQMISPSDSDEDEVSSAPQRQLDKGKGKAKVLPDLPEEVWRLIFQMVHFTREEEAWDGAGISSKSAKSALTPLLISKDMTGITLPILYSHPHLSFSTISSFLKSLEHPSRYTKYSKAAYVNSLTVKASPNIPGAHNIPPSLSSEGTSNTSTRFLGTPYNIHPDLRALLIQFPDLYSFTLKDTLIIHQADSIRLFEALNCIKPRKARLEIRMWNLYESPVGDDIMAVSRPSVYSPMSPPPAADALTLEGFGFRSHYTWRDALHQGHEWQTPIHWIDLGASDTQTILNNPQSVAGLPFPPAAPPSLSTMLAQIPGTIHSIGASDDDNSDDDETPPLNLEPYSLIPHPRESFSTGRGSQPHSSPPVSQLTTLPSHQETRLASFSERTRNIAAFDRLLNRHTLDQPRSRSAFFTRSSNDHTDESVVYRSESSTGVEITTDEVAIPSLPDPPTNERSTLDTRGASSRVRSSARLLRGLPLHSDETDRILPTSSIASDARATEARARIEARLNILNPRPRSAQEDHWPSPSTLLALAADRFSERATVPPPNAFSRRNPTRSARREISPPINISRHPRDQSENYHLPQSIEPHATIESSDSLTDRYHTHWTGSTTHHLAHAIRNSLVHLVEKQWSRRLYALSLVALDPLASVIYRSQSLDFWIHMPIPHIRVHLPRGIHSLAVLKGAKELNADRDRIRDEFDHLLFPDSKIRMVGGDGNGGELLHDDTRLFEIEVNTIAEMRDDVWIRFGHQIPPQVCRILVGEQDWRWVQADCESYTPTPGARPCSPEPSLSTSLFDSPTFSFNSLDSDTEGESIIRDQGNESEGDTYDSSAAADQARRIAERQAQRKRSGLVPDEETKH